MSARRHRSTPLRVRITRDGVLTIEIGIETLAVAALASPFAEELANEFASDRGVSPGETRPDELYRIANPRGFAGEVRAALTEEREDGSSLLTDVIDAAIRKAYEDGSEWWVDAGEDANE